MSSTISSERSEGKPYNQDALNAVQNHHAGADSVSLSAPQTSFATPTIQNMPSAPEQECKRNFSFINRAANPVELQSQRDKPICELEIFDVIKQCSEISADAWRALFDECDFFFLNKFKPTVFFDLLKKRASAAGINLVKDMVFLISIYLHRGNNIDKIISMTRPGAERQYLIRLKEGLCIVKDHRTTSGCRSDAVTLRRIATVFPSFVGKVLLEKPPKMAIKICEEYKLPLWAAAEGLLSMFPQVKEFNVLTAVAKAMLYVYNIALYTFLHSQNAKLPAPNGQRVLRMLDSSFNTDFLRDEHRFLALWRSGVLISKPEDQYSTYPGVMNPEFILAGLYNHLTPLKIFKKRHPGWFNVLIANLPQSFEVRFASTPAFDQTMLINSRQPRLSLLTQTPLQFDEANAYRTRFLHEDNLFDLNPANVIVGAREAVQQIPGPSTRN